MLLHAVVNPVSVTLWCPAGVTSYLLIVWGSLALLTASQLAKVTKSCGKTSDSLIGAWKEVDGALSGRGGGSRGVRISLVLWKHGQ